MVDAAPTAPTQSAPKQDQRLLWIMTALGFAAGLPNVLVIGSLGTWLANAGLSFGAIAVLTWIGLFYAFKFLWAPAIDWLTPPFLSSIGRRRAWMVVCQLVIAGCLFGLVLTDPRENIGMFAAFAAIAGFFSASQDIVIDAWRIEVANPRAPIDSLSTRYQFGYRSAVIVGSAFALLMADVLAADLAAKRRVTNAGVQAGVHGELTLQSSGAYRYTLNPSAPAVAALAPGAKTPLTETFPIAVAGKGRIVAQQALTLEIRRLADGAYELKETGAFGADSNPAAPGAPAGLSGNVALDPADGWASMYFVLAIVMALCVLASWFAPEPLLTPPHKAKAAALDADAIRGRALAVIPVAVGWGLAASAIVWFMVSSLQPKPAMSALAFRDAAIPWILAITVGLPIAAAFWIVRRDPTDAMAADGRGVIGALYQRVLAPLADMVRRYWLWALPVLLLAMTYRIADSIWGALANPFYVKVMGYSNSDIAVASKMVGVAATVAGIAAGAWALAGLGRMKALVVGAVLAAVTNLLYADLALGATWTTAMLNATGLGPLLAWMLNGFVGGVTSAGATIFADVNLGQPLTNLTGVILIENLAGGFASAVYTAWLSSIVNKNYAAVQFALLSSLALLIGVIFRPALGSYVDGAAGAGVAAQAARFSDVFMWATVIGFVAVALAVLEWWRSSREAKAGAAITPSPAPVD
jgi:VCBS repeat-containing protein